MRSIKTTTENINLVNLYAKLTKVAQYQDTAQRKIITFKICNFFIVNREMARTHAHTHGKSHTIRPTSKNAPSWTIANEDIISKIVDFGKEGLTASEIGLRLRDEFAVPLVKPILGKTITQILEENNINKSMPEDLERLVRKALGLQKHLSTHNSDKRNVRALELIESKVHRLSRYYKKNDKIPKNWKYKSVIAKLE